jgi:hypothetical protein
MWIVVGAVVCGVRAADGLAGASSAAGLPAPPEQVERWGLFELALAGPPEDNPFLDVELTARFTQGDRSFDPPGFHDGDGVLCIPKITSAPKRSRWRALLALIFDNEVAGVPVKPGVTA